MKALTQFACQAWCKERGLQTAGRGVLHPERSKSVVLRVPIETRLVLELVCKLLPRDEQFSGGLFWVVDTGSWSVPVITIGQTIVTTMRKSHALDSIEEAPACLFAADERLHAEAFLALPLLFAWGGYYVPDHTQYFFDINPDGVLEVVTEDAAWIDFFSEFPEKIGMRQHGTWIGRNPYAR